MNREDLSYEEDILRNPYSFKTWWFYLEFKHDAAPEVRNLIFERALSKLPRSYKLWFKYINERMAQVKDLCVTDVAYEQVNSTYERALVHMHKMPRIWKEYLVFLSSQKLITRCRHTFDKALRALPITQHVRWVWPAYIGFVKECGVNETAIRVYRRYLKIAPEEVEDFVDFLSSSGAIDEAATNLAELVSDDRFISHNGKSKHDLWTELLKLITKNPREVKSLNVDAVIRSGIKRYAHEVGNLYNALADYYIRLGLFEKARDVYEEGITSVNSVRDFSIVFDSYTKYEESLLTARMEAMAEEEEMSEDSDDEDQIDIDLRLLRLDALVARRPILLSDVLLRQNPHNVNEWLKRVALFKEQPVQAIRTYTEAVTTVDPQQATGKPHLLWISFARFYERHGDLDNARVIFQKASEVNFKSVDALASIWCAYGEMELRHRCYDRALKLLKEALVVPPVSINQFRNNKEKIPVQKKLHKSTKLWSFYVDMEENLGTLQSCKSAYNQMISLEVVTPQIIIGYAQYMEESKYFEESFRVYEKGVALFEYPHVYPIWLCYLRKFIARYQGTKIERTRDLFEQAVQGVPPEHAHVLYLLYAKFEEDHGMARRAMNVYDRCCTVLEPKDKAKMYKIYINRTAEFFGVTKTREVYEQAIRAIPDDHLIAICLSYADLERKLGEIERARAIYTFGSQFANPTNDEDYWKVWHTFEVNFGNQQTFREMLRVHRSVQAQFSQVNMMTASLVKPGGVRRMEDEEDKKEEKAPPAKASRKRPAPSSSSADAAIAAGEAARAALEGKKTPPQLTRARTPEPMDTEEAPLKDASIEQVQVPDAVFGIAEGNVGALERLRRANAQ